MLIAFIAASIVLGIFFSIVWTSNTMSNVLIKMTFIAYTMWAVVMLVFASGVAITFDNGMRLL